MNQHHQASWHNVVAKRNVLWEDGPEGGAVLLIPRFRRGPLARWLQPRLRRPFIRLKLDAIGSFVWRQMDGNTSFNALVAEMKDHFGGTVEPAEDRLKKFMTMLYRDQFVELFVPTDTAAPS